MYFDGIDIDRMRELVDESILAGGRTVRFLRTDPEATKADPSYSNLYGESKYKIPDTEEPHDLIGLVTTEKRQEMLENGGVVTTHVLMITISYLETQRKNFTPCETDKVIFPTDDPTKEYGITQFKWTTIVPAPGAKGERVEYPISLTLEAKRELPR